jgi:hypothetical protein
MSLSKFASEFNAVAFAYGVNPQVPPLLVINGPNATGSAALTLAFGAVATQDGTTFTPLNTNAPIIVGGGSSVETVTPTAVSNSTPLIFGTAQVTATYANLHGNGDQVRSGTVGLQEAINYVAGYGGGVVVVDAGWSYLGGTTAMIAAAVVPANVDIVDERNGFGAVAGNYPASVTALAAPTALTTATAANGMITTAATGGTISNATYRLGITYVDIFGGETTLSTDTASTATIATTGTTSTITITSPAALAGAVGYRVYMSAASGASLSEILYPVGNTAITGTAAVIPGGAALPAFQIGTPVTITAVITGTAKVPSQNSAYAAATVLTTPAPIDSYPPFTALGTIAAAARGVVGTVNFPAGFFNTLGRTVRVKGMYYATTNGTGGTITTELILASVFGVTSITPFTAASSSVAASAITVNNVFEILLVTAATGASGTFECHGTVAYNVAGTAVGTVTMDSVITVSSTLDLTKQITMTIDHLNTTLGTSASQLRQLTIEVLK